MSTGSIAQSSAQFLVADILEIFQNYYDEESLRFVPPRLSPNLVELTYSPVPITQLFIAGVFPIHSLSSPISCNTHAAILFLDKNIPSSPEPV